MGRAELLLQNLVVQVEVRVIQLVLQVAVRAIAVVLHGLAEPHALAGRSRRRGDHGAGSDRRRLQRRLQAVAILVPWQQHGHRWRSHGHQGFAVVHRNRSGRAAGVEVVERRRFSGKDAVPDESAVGLASGTAATAAGERVIVRAERSEARGRGRGAGLPQDGQDPRVERGRGRRGQRQRRRAAQALV